MPADSTAVTRLYPSLTSHRAKTTGTKGEITAVIIETLKRIADCAFKWASRANRRPPTTAGTATIEGTKPKPA